MLQEGAALAALGAADNLACADQQVAAREMLKAENARERLLGPGIVQRSAYSQVLQGSGDDPVHAAQPRFSALPGYPGRQRHAIGDFVMMDERRAARRPADVRQRGKTGVAVPQFFGLEVAQA